MKQRKYNWFLRNYYYFYFYDENYHSHSIHLNSQTHFQFASLLMDFTSWLFLLVPKTIPPKVFRFFLQNAIHRQNDKMLFTISSICCVLLRLCNYTLCNRRKWRRTSEPFPSRCYLRSSGICRVLSDRVGASILCEKCSWISGLTTNAPVSSRCLCVLVLSMFPPPYS